MATSTVKGRGAATPEVDGAAAVEWLLGSEEPAVRYLTRRDVLGEAVPLDPEEFFAGAIVRGLLAGQNADGGFGGHPYKKWDGAHWRLVSLVELGMPSGTPQGVAAAETVRSWLTGDAHRRSVKVIDGLARRCASMEGNAVAVCCRLGLADDPRVELLARSLVEWQWPDGGWNCDKKASGRRSSFHESLPPAWGLHEHRLFRSLRTGEVINERWLSLRYPPYWHYDILQALLVLGRLGRLGDTRADEALELVVQRRRADGRWHADGYWWRPPGSAAYPDVVDWGRRGPNEMVTLNALRVLRMADRPLA
jgi:hypothetical protein